MYTEMYARFLYTPSLTDHVTQDRLHSYADLVEIIRRSEDKENWRDDSRIQCKYFGRCSGCQVRCGQYLPVHS